MLMCFLNVLFNDQCCITYLYLLNLLHLFKRFFRVLGEWLKISLKGHFINIPPLSAGALTVGLVRQCQTIHGRDRTCIPPRLPPEWVTTLFFIIMGIISLTVTCGLLVASHWRREATKYARWIAFTGSKWTRWRLSHNSRIKWVFLSRLDVSISPLGENEEEEV